jgi:potassium/hydrogen antiporter
MSADSAILVFGGLLLVSVLASKASARLGVPALLLFLAVGMLAGSDGPGGIVFDYPHAAQGLGVIALAFILFAGGLETGWSDFRSVLRESLLLATAGVVITAGLTGWIAIHLMGLAPLEGLLLGAVVSSTDAAAVFGILRSRNTGLSARLGALLEAESGSNDPMAVFLTIGLIELIQNPSAPAAALPVLFLRQMLIGAAAGYGAGRLMPVVLNRLRLEAEGLHPVLTVAMVLVLYGGVAWTGGNGFLAVYLAGILLGNSKFLFKRSLLRFHDGLAWLMQIAMFLTLGLQVFPSRLPAVAVSGIAIALFLMLAARPAAVFLVLAFSRLSLRERALVSWVGLRGAAPIVLATFPLVAGLRQADLIFNVVFFIVLASALIQGTTIPFAVRVLGLAAGSARTMADPFDRIARGGRDLVEVVVSAGSPADGKSLLELGLPLGALVLLITKPGGEGLIPRGSTPIEAGDKLTVLAASAQIGTVKDLTGHVDGA